MTAKDHIKTLEGKFYSPSELRIVREVINRLKGNYMKDIKELRAILDRERRGDKTSLYRINQINSAFEHSEALENIGRVTCAKNILHDMSHTPDY